MKLLSVALARVTVLVDSAEVNPRNQVSVPDFVKAITERYGFMKFPRTIEEYDLAKGINFGLGKLGNINITSINLYNVGTVIDTGSATQDCDVIYEDLLRWAMDLVGIEDRPTPDRRFYVSELAFQSNMRLDAINKFFTAISSKVTTTVSKFARQEYNFEPVAIVAMPDMSNIKLGPTSFRIDRLQGAPFEDKKYFSSAPLPTDDHIGLIEEFEKYIGG